MATITTRSGKGSPLTNNEVDANFTNLNTDKAELSGATFTGSVSAPQLAITSASTADTVTLTRGTNGQNNMFKFVTGSTADWIVGERNDSSSDFRIFSYGTSSDVLSISRANGNVNIGSSLMVGSTTAPTSRLHIKAASNSYTGGILIEDTDSSTKSGITHVNGGLYLSSNATNDHLEINSSGNATFTGDVTADKFKLSSTNFIDSPTTSIIRYSVGSGDHVFFSGSTSNSELLRIDGSNGNCTIPNGSLMVGSTTAPTAYTGYSTLALNGTNGGLIEFQKNGVQQSRIANAGGLELQFSTNNTEAMRISSVQNVNIPNGSLMVGSTTAPSAPLTVSAADGTLAVFTNASNADFQFKTSSGVALITPSTGTLAFGTSNTERFRINSDGSCRWTPDGTNHDMTLTASGDLLVGTTQTDIGYTDSGAGVALGADGWIQSARSSTAVNPNVYLNKLDSSGEIVRFAQDGATVGSIGTNSGYMVIGSPVGTDAHLLIGNGLIHPATSTGGAKDNAIDIGGSSNRFKDLFLAGISYTNKVVAQTIFREGSDGSGLHFTSNAIYPTNETSAISDGTESLGAAGYRFKDLYLSSGVYLGGTGAANKLDDYEEGTWTASLSGVASQTLGNNVGYYTKIGHRVFFQWYSSISTIGTANGPARINGLPFTSSSAGASYGLFHYVHGTGVLNSTGGYVNSNATNMVFISEHSVSGSNFSAGSGKYIMIQGSYSVA